MEDINGVSFLDWAYACGNMAQGMTEEKICEVLGIESPIWQQTNEAWTGKLGDIMVTNMEMATKYGEAFSKPQQGKFADVAQVGASDADLEKMVPDYETYQKIFYHQGIASNYGIDPTTVLESYGLDLGSWGKLNMKFMNKGINSVDQTAPDYMEKYKYFQVLRKKWENHWHEHYKENKVDLSDDIDF